MIQVLEFITPHLPSRGRILEVGCGDGALAAMLMREGHEVVPLDRSERAVKRAKERGVEVVHQEFLEFVAAPFDVVLFTRSLHHIFPLRRAVEHAAGLLRPGGRILLDECALSKMDLATARWFYDTVDALRAAGAVQAPDHWHPPHSDPKVRWTSYHHHDPPLHGDTSMLREIERCFVLEKTTRPPLLYRYLVDRVAPDASGLALTRWMESREKERIAEGRVRPLGLRLVARKRARRRGDAR